MSLKKVVGLLAGFALAVGLIGAGVGAQFTTNVTAVEHISVGSFGCVISSATHGAVVNADQTSVDYTAPTILGSQPGNAPFDFTVTSTGDIPVNLHVSEAPALSSPWSDMLGAVPDVYMTKGQSHTYNAGIAWTMLGNANIGQQGTITYTVNCNEGPSLSYTSAKDGPGHLWSSVSLANFPATTEVVVDYTYGTPGWWHLFGDITTDATGASTITYLTAEDCVDLASVTWTQDIPVTFRATWGSPSQTLTEIAGTMVCSQL